MSLDDFRVIDGLHAKRNPRLPEPLPATLMLEPVEVMGGPLPALCWSGVCPGCGRGLISATTSWNLGPGVFYCTRACRAAHGG